MNKNLIIKNNILVLKNVMPTKKYFTLVLISLTLIGCNSKSKNSLTVDDGSNVEIIGALKDVMWKGELQGKIHLDTISNKKGLYGLGPVEYLKGELLIADGKSYVSQVTIDSAMIVEETYNIKAPFFVYANETEWNVSDLPKEILSITDLQGYLNQQALNINNPFVFKLTGYVSSAHIHIQNLLDGAIVSSPKEAHQGQKNYVIENEEIEIIGFYSRNHKGVFTHHDSNIHMHLITANKAKMGHLDEVNFDDNSIKIYLPKN